jgi:hypothetical protein
MEKVAQKPWEELLRERVFAPLGITTAGFGPPSGTKGKHVPWGHGPRFYWRPFRWVRTDVPRHPDSMWADVPRAAAPAGLVHLSMQDWARFVSLLLRGDPANPQRHNTLLKADTLDTLNRVDAGGPPLPGSWGGSGYVSGWVVSEARWASATGGAPGRVLWHQGDNSRWNSAAWIAPEIDMAVLVATNRAFQWEATNEIVRALVDTFAPAAGAPGNGLAGKWRGTLPWHSVLKETPIQVTIQPSETSSPTLTLIDSRKPTPITMEVIAQADGRVVFSASNGPRFEGTLASDGSQISGWWTDTRYRRWVVLRRVEH